MRLDITVPFKNRQVGFTLIEMLVVMVISGILLGLAAPAYQTYVRKSHRAQAKAELATMAQEQSRYYAKNSVYKEIDGKKTAYYSFKMELGESLEPSYVLYAFALDGQRNDKGCAQLELDNFGNKTPPSCW